jgi:phage baseplate assembly protein W
MSNYLKNLPGKKNPRFTDISIGFGLNPFNEDVVRITDADSVKRSIKSLILTDKYERLLDPDIGGNIRASLFEPMTPISENILENYIIECIDNYEPRAILQSVFIQANHDNNSYNVTITFKIDTSETLQSLEFILERVR